MQKYVKSTNMIISQFPKNIVANIAYFLINVIIGILIVPYFISSLGIAAFGLIPLVSSIMGYMAIFIQSLNTSVSRYLTIDLQKEDYISANRTFNTAIFGLSFIIAIMVPVIILIAYFIPNIFNIPIDQKSEVVFLFLGVCAAFFIRSWSGNFTVQLFAYNRLDLQNIVNITNIVVQTGLIIFFFKVFHPSLALIGMAYAIGAISASVVAVVLAKRVSPHLKVSISFIDKSRLKVLFSMSWWTIVDGIGTLFLLQVDLIIVNLLFGATLTGEYAIAFQWAGLLRGITSMFSGVLIPAVFTYYAKEQIDTLTKMMISAIKLMGVLLALPIGLICGFAPQILTIWVGDKYTVLAPLIVLVTLPLIINLAVVPLFSINVAYNRIRLPGIITIITGVINIFLAIALPLLTGWGYYGVAAAGAIVLTLKNLCFTPWYAEKVVGIKVKTIFKSLIPGIITTIIIFIISVIIGIFIPIGSLISLIFIGGILGVIYSLLVWRYVLTNFERKLFGSYLPNNLMKLII